MMNLVFIMMNSQAAPRSRVPPPLSEDVQKRLYGPGKDLVGFRRKMAMDKAHVCVGFGSSSPPRAGPGSREVETDERAFGAGWTVITGVATKREGGEEAAPASPEQEPVKFVAVAVRKAPPKAGAGLRRLDAAGHAKREKQRFPAKPQPPPLAGAKSPVESAAGTELLGIIADAHNAISSKRPAVTGLRSHQAAAKASEPGPEPEPEPEPKSEPVPEPAAEAEVLSPRVARVDDVGGAGMYRVLASATVRESPDATSKKVGEFKKGAVIDVVHAQTNAQGVTVFQTVTVPSGKKRGGWVKPETSKGKPLLERVPSPTPQEPAHEEPTVHAHVAAVGGGSKEDATAAACEWLADKGHADAVGQMACSALAAAEMPCGEWIQELESMDSEGILVAFLGSLKNMPVAADFARSRSPSPSTEPEKPLDLEPASSSVRSSTVTISVMCPLNHKPGQPVKIETDHGTVTVPAPAGIEAGDMFDAEVEVLTAGGSDSLTTVAAGELSGGSLDDLYDQLQATVSPTSVTADDSQAPAAETKLTPSPRASLAESQPSDDYEDDGGAARPDMDIGKWLDEIGANGSIEDAFLDADINTLEDLSNVISTPADLEKYLPSTDLVKLGWLEVARIRREEGTHMSSRATEAANLLAVVCPEGVSAGEKVVVEGPDGQDIDAMVPEGVVAGQTFEVDIGAVGTLVSVSSGPTMTVTVPAGCAGGDIIAITVSDGQELQVRVPDGVDEGEEFECAT